ncbi:putative exported phage-related protein [Yersinia pseudotuberculosis]|uniref:DUF3850 domain-containing protein n=1 Tax=Yersinia pseudotuberculosis TaxID=633 RepID=UPI0005E94649|nr:DUF3850 domain-containing protein [Yersinia pseudotuberculosis]CNL45165.1 putative exported phage-related protein [Yersinia pseudotuberculosis]
MEKQKETTDIPAIIYLRNFIKRHPGAGLHNGAKDKAFTDLSYLESTLNKQSTAIDALKKQVEIVSGAAMKVSGYLDSIVTAIEATTHGKNCTTSYAHKTVSNVISAINKTESAYREALDMQGVSQEILCSLYTSPKLHRLKILPEYFNAVFNGYKKAELRANDRDFSVGDFLLLREWELTTEYSGRKLVVEITHITPCDFALPNYVMLSFNELYTTNYSRFDDFDGGVPF